MSMTTHCTALALGRATRIGSGRAQASNRLTVASRNVSTLVESAGGDRRISRSRAQPISRGVECCVDRKLDLLVKELKRYRVSVAAIQETRWFGKGTWQADDFVFVHSGRPLPAEGEPALPEE